MLRPHSLAPRQLNSPAALVQLLRAAFSRVQGRILPATDGSSLGFVLERMVAVVRATGPTLEDTCTAPLGGLDQTAASAELNVVILALQTAQLAHVRLRLLVDN